MNILEELYLPAHDCKSCVNALSYGCKCHLTAEERKLLDMDLCPYYELYDYDALRAEALERYGALLKSRGNEEEKE